MYNVSTTNRFDKDLKRCMKRGLNMQLIYDAILLLRTTGTLPPQYRPHQLKGDHKGQWECHIQPNWLMTWEQNDKQLTLLFLETGTHADIFWLVNTKNPLFERIRDFSLYALLFGKRANHSPPFVGGVWGWVF